MTGLIAVTDYDWFDFLRRQSDLDEVNFWRPSDTRTPRQLKPGMPVLFKLRKEHGDWIVGWGIFARHDVLPVWLAWDAFESKNGAASFAQMRERIERLRHGGKQAQAGGGDYEIGCLMLAQPVFLPREAWVKPPSNWPENAVQGKAYDLSKGEGARAWQECRERGGDLGGLGAIRDRPQPPPPTDGGHDIAGDRPRAPLPPPDRYGAPGLVRPRLGQGIFRLAVTDAYGRSCAVTDEHSLPALEAAHIRPYGDGGEHEIPNGLLLRSDIHRLFDKGYVGVTPDYKFVVSRRLKDDFANGRSYYPSHGKPIRLPERAEDRPSRQWLEWHLAERFRDSA